MLLTSGKEIATTLYGTGPTLTAKFVRSKKKEDTVLYSPFCFACNWMSAVNDFFAGYSTMLLAVNGFAVLMSISIGPSDTGKVTAVFVSASTRFTSKVAPADAETTG